MGTCVRGVAALQRVGGGAARLGRGAALCCAEQAGNATACLPFLQRLLPWLLPLPAETPLAPPPPLQPDKPQNGSCVPPAWLVVD